MYKPVITWVYYYLKANKLKNCSLDSIKVNLIEWMLKQNELNDIKIIYVLEEYAIALFIKSCHIYLQIQIMSQ